MRSRSSPWRSNSASSTSPTVAPSTSTLAVAAGGGAQLRRDLDLDRHQPRTPAPSTRSIELVERRRDLVGLERAAHRVERLQALAGDDEHDALVRVDVAALGELGEHRGRRAAGGLGEDAGRLGEQADAGADLVVGDLRRCCRRSRRARSSAYGPSAGLPIASDLAIVFGLDRAGRSRGRRRTRCATGLQPSAWAPFIVGTSPVMRPELEPLREALGDLRVQRAGGDRRDDAVGRLPAELLGDLVGERLRALASSTGRMLTFTNAQSRSPESSVQRRLTSS